MRTGARSALDQAHRHLSPPKSTAGATPHSGGTPGGHGKDCAALGVYGHYISVDAVSKTVMVNLSDYGDQQDERETLDALRALARTG